MKIRLALILAFLAFAIRVALGFNCAATHADQILVSKTVLVLAVLGLVAFILNEKYAQAKSLNFGFALFILIFLLAIPFFGFSDGTVILETNGRVKRVISPFEPHWDKEHFIPLADLPHFFNEEIKVKGSRIEFHIEWLLDYKKETNVAFLKFKYPPGAKQDSNEKVDKEISSILSEIVSDEINKIDTDAIHQGKPIQSLLNTPDETIVISTITEPELKALRERIIDRLEKSVPDGLEQTRKPRFLRHEYDRSTRCWSWE